MQQTLDNSQIRCQNHKDYSVEALYFNENNETCGLKCLECVTEENISPSNLLLLKKLLSNNENIFFPNWPPLKEQLNGTLNNLFSVIKEIKYDEQIQQIKNYFKELRIELLSIIDQKESEVLQEITLNAQCKENIISKYKQISSREELKEIFNNINNNFAQSKTILKNLIKNKYENLEQNSIQIEEILSNKHNTQELIDEQNFNEFKNKIKSDIQTLNVFKIETKKKEELIKQQSMFGDCSASSWQTNLSISPNIKYEIVFDIEKSQQQQILPKGLFQREDFIQIGISSYSLSKVFYHFTTNTQVTYQNYTIQGEPITASMIERKARFLIKIFIDEQVFEITDLPKKVNISGIIKDCLIQQRSQHYQLEYSSSKNFKIEIQSIRIVNQFQ